MGIFSSKNDPKFFEDCQRHLSQLDSTLTSLAFSIDSIHKTTELLLQQLEDGVIREDETDPRNRCITLVKEILHCVEKTLCVDKMAFVEGISHFIHMLINGADNKQVIAKYIPVVKQMQITKYIVDFNKKQKPKNSASKEKTGSEGGADRRITNSEVSECLLEIQQENDQLVNEKESLESTLALLQNELKQIKEDSASKLEELKNENDRLRKELDDKTVTIETIPVQIYRQRKGDLMDMIEDELVTMLNDHFGPHNLKLDVVMCGDTSEVNQAQPLLVLCISTSRLGTDAKNAVQGVSQLGRTALLIFHHKDLHALPSQVSDRVLAGPDFQALRGIFDLAFLTGKGMYGCDMNTKAIEGIVAFISSVTEKCQNRKLFG